MCSIARTIIAEADRTSRNESLKDAFDVLKIQKKIVFVVDYVILDRNKKEIRVSKNEKGCFSFLETL